MSRKKRLERLEKRLEAVEQVTNRLTIDSEVSLHKLPHTRIGRPGEPTLFGEGWVALVDDCVVAKDREIRLFSFIYTGYDTAAQAEKAAAEHIDKLKVVRAS